jgi:hypothetical protein
MIGTGMRLPHWSGLRALVRIVAPVLAAAAALASLAALGGCADDRLAGGGTETGNAEIVSGRIVDSDGRGVLGINVLLQEVRTRLDGGDSGAAQSIVSDDSGRYRFKAVKPGRYALFASNPPGTNGVHTRAAILTRIDKRDSALGLQDATARESVNLSGRVFPASPTDLASMLICVPGSGSCAHPRADSTFDLPAAPRGSYELLFLTATASHYLGLQVRAEAGSMVQLRDVSLKETADADHVPYRFYALKQTLSFSIVPMDYPLGGEPERYRGATLSDVNYYRLSETGPPVLWTPDYLSAWKYSRTLDGDSLYTGGDLAKPLIGFPILVRLSAPGFDFSQAAAGGSDLVFSDTAGRLLPFQIERWDAAAGRAEIWVRVDSLAAAKAGRKLRLHWGRSDRPGMIPPPFHSDGAKVFLPADGFKAAWHFNDTTAAKVDDVWGTFPGTFTNPLPAEGAAGLRTSDGAVGPALRLGKTGAYVHVPYQAGLDVDQTFTVSVWAKLQLPDNGLKQVLAAKWMTGRREWHFDLQPNRTFELEFGGADGNILGTWRSAAPVANPGVWHHYAAVFDKGSVKLYLDGAEAAGSAATGSVPAAINHFTADLSLGSNSIDTTLNLRGDLDEFRLYQSAKSADWLGMSYRTEKPRP